MPPILLLQIDNCVSDNKNHDVFSFLSLLTSRRVFEIFEVWFLGKDPQIKIWMEHMRGYNMNAKTCIFMLKDAYRTCQDHNSHVTYLIEEFFDFKRFVEPHVLSGNSKIIWSKDVIYSKSSSFMIGKLCNIKPHIGMISDHLLLIPR